MVAVKSQRLTRRLRPPQSEKTFGLLSFDIVNDLVWMLGSNELSSFHNSITA